MENENITTQAVVDTAEGIIASASSKNLDKVIGFSVGVTVLTLIGIGIHKGYTHIKNKKQQNEASADDQVDVETSESAE